MKVSAKVNDIEVSYEDDKISGYSGNVYHERCIEALKLVCEEALKLLAASYGK